MLCARTVAGDDFYVSLRDIQFFSEQANELIVGRAVDRRCTQSDEKRIVAGSSDRGSGRARDDTDGEDDVGTWRHRSISRSVTFAR